MLNGECIVDPQGTEIDLVRELKKIGIDLRKFTFFNNRGNEECFVVSWEVTDARS